MHRFIPALGVFTVVALGFGAARAENVSSSATATLPNLEGKPFPVSEKLPTMPKVNFLHVGTGQ
jgi:hypothetical protein